jgi:hypothetical protein
MSHAPNCINESIIPNSIVVTIAIQTHGVISDTNLSPEVMKIFDNVRLFSKAGIPQDVVSTRMIDANTLPPLNKRLQRNLGYGESTLDIIETYSRDLKVKYLNYLDFENIPDYEIQGEKTCMIYPHITIDKVFSLKPTSFSDRFLDCVGLGQNGIFLVSVHEYDSESGELKFIYPNKNNNLLLNNIKEFTKFANFFDSFSEDLYSTDLPHTLKLNKNKIQTIRMSKLVEIVKKIFHSNECFINLMDYSCSSISETIPKEDLQFLKYYATEDIETGHTPKWGGRRERRDSRGKVTKNCKKRIKKTRNVRKIKKTRKI